MKTMRLSISLAEATSRLRASLKRIPTSAIKVYSEIDLYGSINSGENETTFTVGRGPTGYTTAEGRITATGENESEISYEFKGVSFMTRLSVSGHIKRIFRNCIARK